MSANIYHNMNNMNNFNCNSPCDSVPSYLALTHFYANNQDFYSIVTTINDYLRERPSIAATFDASSNSFECVQVYDNGDERVDSINIYWDEDRSDHVIEVRRLRGDTLFHCSTTSSIYKIFIDLESVYEGRYVQPLNPPVLFSTLENSEMPMFAFTNADLSCPLSEMSGLMPMRMIAMHA